jgi:hypothetical protein
VNPQTVLTTVSQVDPIRVMYQLSEEEYLRLQQKTIAAAGQTPVGPVPDESLELVLSDGTSYPHPGRMLLAGREVDIKTGTITAIGLFPNPGNLLRPGQYAKVRAVTEVKHGAVLVPQRAVNEMQGTFQVAIVGSDNKAEVRAVQPAERIGSLWLIEKGVNAGELVVTEGFSRVKNGSEVAQGKRVPRSPPLAPLRRQWLRPERGDTMARFFINRPIVAIVLAILTVLLGVVSIVGLPISQFPDIIPPLIQITTSYPGADALTIEQSVATPIEQQMNGVEDMLYLQSVNASDGTMSIRVTFEIGTDRNSDQVNAQNRVSKPRPASRPR